MLAHNVYFKLKDASQQNKDKLIAACNKHLTGHPGVKFYACGTLCDQLRREVNDLDFDVALHIVFESVAAHDAYQVAPRHEQFVEENKASWSKVRVFDSVVETA